MKGIILAGGTGDRLWPLSRRDCPKQFLKMNNGNSLFQETITRNIPFCDGFVIVTNREYEYTVKAQLSRFQGLQYTVVLEEQGRGTAPALAVASRMVGEEDELLILPSNLCFNGNGYSDAIYEAKKYSGEGQIVLFGVYPENPDTRYGYIRHKREKVTRFVEKPSAELAQKVFADDDIFWNSGMILCQNAVFRSELSRFAQPLVQWATEVAGNRENDQGGDLALGKEELQRVQYGSIEKVLLEASEELAVVKLRCEWKDISSFEAYASVCRNTLAQANHCIMDSCENTTLINKGSSRLVVANSLRDTVIVNTDDAVYISDVHAQQEIKRIMDADQGVHSDFFDHAVRVYRDWGCREQIAQGSGFRIRKVTLYPGKSISSHSHMNRTENYSVVQGVLSVELDGKYSELSAGENINVRPGQIHRLFNKQDVDTVMIEVDTGADINESDMEHVLQMPSLYRLLPAFKDYLWGGDRLVTQFGKNSPYSTTAESWELSAHPAGQSVIAGGPMDGKLFGDFVNQYGRKVAGWKSSTFDRFPILIKFIDATNPLSVQIHPDDDYAFPNENEFGKNEMWYVMDAEPGAFLYCGFKRDVTRQEVETRIKDNTVTEILNKVMVKPGDCVFIPAGTIHAIGAGILICEIQQNSNSTYRVYDYDRRDKDGNPRELHIAKALDVMDFSQYHRGAYGYEDTKGNRQRLCQCKYFECTRIAVDGDESIYVDDSSFVSLVFLAGTGMVCCGEETLTVKAGDSVFVAAGRKVVHVTGECELIMTGI